MARNIRNFKNRIEAQQSNMKKVNNAEIAAGYSAAFSQKRVRVVAKRKIIEYGILNGFCK